MPVQLARLSPAEYQAWLLRTSRGKARFFASDGLEAVTKVKWYGLIPHTGCCLLFS